MAGKLCLKTIQNYLKQSKQTCTHSEITNALVFFLRWHYSPMQTFDSSMEFYYSALFFDLSFHKCISNDFLK